MNTTNWLVLAGAIVVAGKWSRGDAITPKTVIAVCILALMVSVLQDVDPEIANAFTLLILTAVILGNLQEILNKISPPGNPDTLPKPKPR